ncbi:MAG: type II toxin-antitoxin system HicA family toxin [Algiphilus sp.]
MRAASPEWGSTQSCGERFFTGSADTNIAFADLRQLLIRLEFVERVRGDHHIFMHVDVDEILNLQPRGKLSKPYQVRQVRNMLVKHRLGEADVDSI